MNHSPSGSLLLSKAIPGFINYKTAEGLALRTIDSHERLLNKWLEHIGDQEIGKISAQDVVAYISWLRNEYTRAATMGKPTLSRQSHCAMCGSPHPPSTPGLSRNWKLTIL